MMGLGLWYAAVFWGVPGETEEPVVVQKVVAQWLAQGFLLVAGLGAADVGDDDAAVHHPGQALETVMYLVPGVDAFAGFLDVAPGRREKSRCPNR